MGRAQFAIASTAAYLFFYLGAFSNGHVKVTNDDCRILLDNYRCGITQQLYQL
jgi:hypothetical protein